MIYEAKSQPCLAFNLFTFGRITLWGKKPVNATPNSAITMFILLLKVTGISEDQLLVAVLAGLPTTAELFIVPEKGSRGGVVDEKWANLDQVPYCQIPLIKPDRYSVWGSVIIKCKNNIVTKDRKSPGDTSLENCLYIRFIIQQCVRYILLLE